jgi:organic radical activating enzyme
MRATSLSINLVGSCNAHCPFCLSSAAWKAGRSDNRLLRQALPRALAYARYHGVDTVLITGSGEPTLQRDLIFHLVAETKAAGIPITELQTNGALFTQNPEYLDELGQLNLTTVALSVASVDAARSAQTMEIGLDYFSLIGDVARRGMLCRVTLNMVDHDRDALLAGLGAYADRLSARGARQLTLRALNVPEHPENTEEARRKAEWLGSHALPAADVGAIEAEIRSRGVCLRTLPYGAAVYDYHRLSVCIDAGKTEATGGQEIRSLILMPDGHVYHAWNHAGSILL